MTGMEYEQTRSTATAPIWSETVAFCRTHLSAVLKVLLPPIAVGYLSAVALQHQINLIQTRIMASFVPVMNGPGVIAYERLWLPMQLLFILKQWFLWICYCFALIGICKLVKDRTEEEHPAETSVFSTIRDRPVRFISSATWFFGVLILGYVGITFVISGIVIIQTRAHIPYRMPWETWTVAFGTIALVSAVIVRWAFAVPLAVLNNLPFAAAMRWSDQLSNYRMLSLWALVMESEITGYLALIAPSYARVYLHLPATAFTYYSGEAVSILLTALTQAPLMVGIALVIARNVGESQPMYSGATASNSFIHDPPS